MTLSKLLPAVVLVCCTCAIPANAGYATYFKDTTHYDSGSGMDVAGSDGLIDHDREPGNGVDPGGNFVNRPPVTNSQIGYNSFITGLGPSADFGIEDFEDKGRTGFAGIPPTGIPATAISLNLRFDRLAPAMGSLPITATLNGIGQVASITDVTKNSAGRFPVSIPVNGTQYFDTNFETLAFTITFDQAINGFGFFGTDLGDFNGQIALDITDVNNVKTTITVPHEQSGVENDISTYLNDSLLFFGVTSDVAFKKVEFRNTGGVLDRFGFDNLIVSQAEVPEPASLALFTSGLFCAGGAWRLRKRSGKPA